MARGSQATRPARPRGRPAPGGDGSARGGAFAQRLRSSAPSRYLLAHPGVAAGLLFGLFVLAYLWPVLIGGKILSPIAMLYGSTPWDAFVPPPSQTAGWFNELLTDVPTADYPWRFLVRQMLHEGTFPSWNPYVFGGIPLYSNPQTGLFSLFSLPLWILPLNYGIGVGAALKLWAGALGTYLLVRELRLRFLPALLAGVCFSFSAIDIVWLTHETLPAVAAMLPWALWLVERIFRGGRLGALLGLAVVTAIGLGGGHPGMQVHLMAAAGTYALLRAAFLGGEPTWGERLRPFGIACGGLVLGGLLMGAMLVPEMLSSQGTIGTIARSHGSGTLPGTTMPLTTIRTTLFPDWWGRVGHVVASTQPTARISSLVAIYVNYNERTFYAGGVAVVMALVGLVASGGWRRKGPFVVLAALGLAIPLHFPGLYQLVTHLPAFELVQNQRLHFVWALAVAVLAAFGLQAVLERPEGDRRRLAALLAALSVGLVALFATGASGRDVGHTIVHFLSGRDFRSDGVLALTSVAWYLLLVAAVGIALLAARRWPSHRVAIAAVVVAVAAFDMLHFAHGYQPMVPESKAIPPRTPAIAFLMRHRDDGRFVGIEGALRNDWPLTYGLRDIRGYDPPQPTLRFYRLWQVANSEQLDWQAFAIESLGDQALQVASVLGARYVVTDPGTQIPTEGGAPAHALRRVYDGRDARIFLNPRAAPRAMVAPRVLAVSGEDEARATVAEAGFDPRRDAAVEGAAAAGLASGRAAGGSASVVGETNARVTLRASLPRRGVVVLNDNWSDGWSVRVDGRPATPVRVNDVMRGVIVDPGVHRVEWSYRVPGLRLGALLSLLGLAALAAGAVALLVQRRRRPPRPAAPSA